MKRAIFLATAALLAMLVLVPMALAQDTTMFQGTTIFAGGGGGGNFGTTSIEFVGGGGGGGPTVFEGTTIRTFTGGRPGPTPPTGGPAILLPAAALLLGSGILTYAILRRR